MKETYKKILDNLDVIEKVKEDLLTMTEEEAVIKYKSELKNIKKNWNEYSKSDGVLTNNICLLLKIKCIKKGYHKKDLI